MGFECRVLDDAIILTDCGFDCADSLQENYVGAYSPAALLHIRVEPLISLHEKTNHHRRLLARHLLQTFSRGCGSLRQRRRRRSERSA